MIWQYALTIAIICGLLFGWMVMITPRPRHPLDKGGALVAFIGVVSFTVGIISFLVGIIAAIWQV